MSTQLNVHAREVENVQTRVSHMSAEASFNGKPYEVLEVTLAGTAVQFFVTPEQADALVKDLAKALRSARTRKDGRREITTTV